MLKRTLVARSGDRFKLDRPLRENLWLAGTPTASSLFPILSGENVNDLVIETSLSTATRRITRTSTVTTPAASSSRIAAASRFGGSIAHDQNGDGISWQVCHDVTVEGCRSHDHTGLGLHPGSGSLRPSSATTQLSERDRHLLLLGRAVRPGRAEYDRGRAAATGSRSATAIPTT